MFGILHRSLSSFFCLYALFPLIYPIKQFQKEYMTWKKKKIDQLHDPGQVPVLPFTSVRPKSDYPRLPWGAAVTQHEQQCEMWFENSKVLFDFQ